MEEVWKAIGSSKYSVSNIGRLRNNKTKRILKTYVVEGGYLRIGIKIEESRQHYRVHRLVAEAFIPNPENKPEVDHINRDKKDNRAENLRWATREENLENSGKYSKEDIETIINLSKLGMTAENIYLKINNIQ